MTEEELIKFLKDNLEIVIKENDGGCPCCIGPGSIEIILKLDSEPISSDFFSLPSHS